MKEFAAKRASLLCNVSSCVSITKVIHLGSQGDVKVTLYYRLLLGWSKRRSCIQNIAESFYFLLRLVRLVIKTSSHQNPTASA